MRDPAIPAVRVRGLRMRYGTNDVLHGVEFEAYRGEVVCLLGPNGAGKTTTIEILEGFRMRSAGEVSVLGVDPAHGGEDWRARLGVVLQSWRDHGKWRVRELLEHLGRYYAPYSTPSIRRPWDPDELIKAVGLTEHAQQKIKTLSGRQRRRLDVAISIDGQHFVHSTTEATKYVYELFKQHGETVADLEVRRASLEDTYMTLVHRAETGAGFDDLVEAGAR